MSLSASNAPSFVHVTVVAGEPVEVQFRVKRELKSEVVPRDVMDTGAVTKIMKSCNTVYNKDPCFQNYYQQVCITS